ncbi:biotin--[acetyl-CoA-carboxylase] ligase [Halosquirtibacter xylanolyticus]|uniref:biotin--[acetyl-CoA-carboxylase] ligase n=1 Tax=Halosquirtibacter xylanolyticus TaxID=3374599 RepID=UPI0037485DB3|nr:biotin--[acetyl-CoA-carboxylase] ligase [Prolixibacteraceae bacterium]
MNTNIGDIIVQLNHIDSTNNYANRLLQTKSQVHGTTIFANLQTAGKGQKGNYWESTANQNLTFSIILEPRNIEITEQFRISQAISLGLCSYLQQKTAQKVTIKWPNDIYVDNNKICGILIETKWMGSKVSVAVAGIGLNINQQHFSSDAPNPISLSQITGQTYDLETERKELLQHIQTQWDIMERDPNMIDNHYHQQLYLHHITATYEDKYGIFKGTIIGVNSIGQLEVEKEDKTLHTYNFKEIRLIHPAK